MNYTSVILDFNNDKIFTPSLSSDYDYEIINKENKQKYPVLIPNDSNQNNNINNKNNINNNNLLSQEEENQ